MHTIIHPFSSNPSFPYQNLEVYLSAWCALPWCLALWSTQHIWGPTKTNSLEKEIRNMKRNKQKEEILLRKHCELDVWLRTRVQEEEVGKDGGMQDRRQDLAWHTNGNGGRRPKLVLQAAERGGKDGEAIPTELHLPHDFWLQGWTCPGTDVCLDKTHSEHVADLSL